MSDPVNPYAAPNAELSAPAPETAAALNDASGGARLLNLVIDAIVIGLLRYGLGVALALTGGRAEGLSPKLIGLGITLAYYLLCEAMLGRTVGKLLTGTRVVTADGGQPRFAQILGRTAARFVPFEAFSFLGSTSGWHDRWSGTRVIRVRQ
jgi:uncharacterized RDD family membrane protein YckC